MLTLLPAGMGWDPMGAKQSIVSPCRASERGKQVQERSANGLQGYKLNDLRGLEGRRRMGNVLLLPL